MIEWISLNRVSINQSKSPPAMKSSSSSAAGGGASFFLGSYLAAFFGSYLAASFLAGSGFPAGAEAGAGPEAPMSLVPSAMS